MQIKFPGCFLIPGYLHLAAIHLYLAVTHLYLAVGLAGCHVTAVIDQVVHQFAGRGRAQDGRVVLLLKHHRLVTDHHTVTGENGKKVTGNRWKNMAT